MSAWDRYRSSRTTWGINVLGSFCVEIEASNGLKGFATGFGGPPACWLAKQHFERFLIGAGKSTQKDLLHILSRLPLTTPQRRSKKYQSLVRADVPSFHVLRPERTACRRDLGY